MRDSPERNNSLFTPYSHDEFTKFVLLPKPSKVAKIVVVFHRFNESFFLLITVFKLNSFNQQSL